MTKFGGHVDEPVVTSSAQPREDGEGFPPPFSSPSNLVRGRLIPVADTTAGLRLYLVKEDDQ